MDTRFIEVKRVKYPLYRKASSLKFWLKILLLRRRNLKKTIADIFRLEERNIELFNSESEAIIKILIHHKSLDNIMKVYIPAFSCTELADSIISAGCIPVLYEIDRNLNPTKEVLCSIEGKKDLVLIIPSLFGLNYLSENFLRYLKLQKYVVIFDEAQSFPIGPRICGMSIQRWYSVVSFGPSKPIGSVGGGALIAHFESGVLKEEVKENNEKYINDLFKELNNIIINKLCLRYKLRRCINKKFKRKLYDSLEELQANSIYKEKKTVKISIFQEKCAGIRIGDYRKWAKDKEVIRLKKQLLQLVEKELGKESLKLIKKDIKNQSVFALFIKDNMRYKVGKKFASRGIQTTLYYLPIPLINRYKGKYMDAVDGCGYKNSKKIIESILIIPCNLDYGNKEIRSMIEEMKGALK